jgi:hypothetical protein
MCLDDVKLKSHQCLNDCPVCYIFSFENLARLLRGSSIQLGAVDHFVEVAQLGCRLCIMLSKAWSFDKEVNPLYRLIHELCHIDRNARSSRKVHRSVS